MGCAVDAKLDGVLLRPVKLRVVDVERERRADLEPIADTEHPWQILGLPVAFDRQRKRELQRRRAEVAPAMQTEGVGGVDAVLLGHGSVIPVGKPGLCGCGEGVFLGLAATLGKHRARIVEILGFAPSNQKLGTGTEGHG